MALRAYLSRHFDELLGKVEAAASPHRYAVLRRKLVLIMVAVAVLPLAAMSVINVQQYQHSLSRELQNPMRVLLNKTRSSFEFFLAERTASVSFVAAAYSFEDLAEEHELNRIFQVIKQKFEGFVDLGLIAANGTQVSYAGPYKLQGKDYSEQAWFNEVIFKGRYVSDVFLGFRHFPHLVVAVQHLTEDGSYWVLRATIDTRQFDRLIASAGLEPDMDMFLVNRAGVLQTNSLNYGRVLEQLPFELPPATYETNVRTFTDPEGRDLFMAYTFFPDTEYALLAVKPRTSALKTWYTLRTDLAAIFLAGVLFILVAAYKLMGMLIRRLQESDDRRELALRQMEHTQKLSSIGRLAAGVAHEVNNPLAIINEKAGLMKDLMAMRQEFPDRERYSGLIDAILRSVDRCRGITHRMLGFARQMDVKIENIDVNEVLTETVSFLEKEASYRNIELSMDLAESLPPIASDRGQLQQVFLNIVNNAFAAVADNEGKISVTTWDKDPETLGVSIKDNGCGMHDDTLKHIFEPFFTTKKGSGTGLGLSITYGIVKRLGGDIAVQSKPGQGTAFTIFLPKNAPNGASKT
ncbi:MAG: ATP-binding protein [Thermodesulfobacteriota bacterium]